MHRAQKSMAPFPASAALKFKLANKNKKSKWELENIRRITRAILCASILSLFSLTNIFDSIQKMADGTGMAKGCLVVVNWNCQFIHLNLKLTMLLDAWRQTLSNMRCGNVHIFPITFICNYYFLASYHNEINCQKQRFAWESRNKFHMGHTHAHKHKHKQIKQTAASFPFHLML